MKNKKMRKLKDMKKANISLQELVVIIPAVIVIGITLLAFTKNVALAGTSGPHSGTSDSVRNLVEEINQLNDGQSIKTVILVRRGTTIEGFSSGESVAYTRALGGIHIFVPHQKEIVKHPLTGVCSNNDACLCEGTTKDYCKDNRGQCYALADQIKKIYVVGDNQGVNLGMSTYQNKKYYYLVLAATSWRSYQIEVQMTRKGDTILIELLKLRTT